MWVAGTQVSDDNRGDLSAIDGVTGQVSYNPEAISTTQLLFINFGEKETTYCLPIAAKARKAGIRVEVYPDKVKMKKQMSYANAKGIPFVALAGDNEIEARKVTLKNMASGEQSLVSPEELVAQIIG